MPGLTPQGSDREIKVQPQEWDPPQAKPATGQEWVFGVTAVSQPANDLEQDQEGGPEVQGPAGRSRGKAAGRGEGQRHTRLPSLYGPFTTSWRRPGPREGSGWGQAHKSSLCLNLSPLEIGLRHGPGSVCRPQVLLTLVWIQAVGRPCSSHSLSSSLCEGPVAGLRLTTL